MITKRPFLYDSDRSQENARRRRKLLNRVQHGDAEAAIAWLRSGVRLTAEDRTEIASLIGALRLRGRQPGEVAVGEFDARARQVYAACCAKRAAERGHTRKRLPRGRWAQLVEAECEGDQALIARVLSLAHRKPK